MQSRLTSWNSFSGSIYFVEMKGLRADIAAEIIILVRILQKMPLSAQGYIVPVL